MCAYVVPRAFSFFFRSDGLSRGGRSAAFSPFLPFAPRGDLPFPAAASAAAVAAAAAAARAAPGGGGKGGGGGGGVAAVSTKRPAGLMGLGLTVSSAAWQCDAALRGRAGYTEEVVLCGG